MPTQPALESNHLKATVHSYSAKSCILQTSDLVLIPLNSMKPNAAVSKLKLLKINSSPVGMIGCTNRGIGNFQPQHLGDLSDLCSIQRQGHGEDFWVRHFSHIRATLHGFTPTTTDSFRFYRWHANVLYFNWPFFPENNICKMGILMWNILLFLSEIEHMEQSMQVIDLHFALLSTPPHFFLSFLVPSQQ